LTDMDDGQAPDRPTVDDAARWLSFADLATLRGISRASASKLVRRHGWRRQTDNQGRVLILVPAEALDRPTDGPADRPPPMTDGRPADSPSDRPMDTPISAVVVLEEVITGLREDLSEANKRADAAMALAGQTAAQLAEAGTRADASLALATSLQRDLASALAAADQARVTARDAEERAVALAEADAERKARGRLRRAWDGLRGR